MIRRKPSRPGLFSHTLARSTGLLNHFQQFLFQVFSKYYEPKRFVPQPEDPPKKTSTASKKTEGPLIDFDSIKNVSDVERVSLRCYPTIDDEASLKKAACNVAQLEQLQNSFRPPPSA